MKYQEVWHTVRIFPTEPLLTLLRWVKIRDRRLEFFDSWSMYFDMENKNNIYVIKTNDALFILRLFRQSTPTCFGHIWSPSSGGILYIYNNWYVLCFSLSVGQANLLMMGYKYAKNM